MEMPMNSPNYRLKGQVKSDGMKTVGIERERYPVGIAYVCIPSNIKREDYITGCIRSGKLGLFFDTGDFVWDVPVDTDKLERVIFPEKYGDLGSMVVWVNVPKHNVPIVIGIISKDDDFHSYEYGQTTLEKDSSAGSASVVVDEKGQILITAKSFDPESAPRIITRLGSFDIPGDFQTTIFGVKADYVIGSVYQSATKDFTWVVQDQAIDELQSSITFKKGEGYTYLDEFENLLKMEDQKMTLDSPEILHGANATESAVKGDTLESLLEQLIDAINLISVTTAVGPSGPPINAAQFIAIKNQLATFKSDKNKIE